MKGVRLAVALVMAAVCAPVFSQEDPGRTAIGRVSVTVYHATDGDPQAAGKKTVKVSELTEKRLRSEESLRFAHYRLLGQDVQPLLRSYESWAQPLKPSDEVLVRFEARSRPTPESTALDLELWLSRKKVLKMDVRLQGDRPLFMLGPEWRGGRLIIGVALAPAKNPGS
jgi:hypothetical protein